MGKIDVAIYDYISDKTRIADLFNGVYFEGRQTRKLFESKLE